MMFVIRVLLVFLLTSGTFSSVFAENKMWKLLGDMNHALETSNYQGTFVFIHDGIVEAMRIVHGYTDYGVREKLVSLTGDAREVIRDKDLLTCILPKDKLVVIETARAGHGLPSVLLENLDQLAIRYQLEEAGSDRIAGFSCKIVRFDPMDAYRYGHELCINTETGMLLKSRTFDVEGETIESMMFTSFRMLDHVPDSAFEHSTSLEDYTWKTVGASLNGKMQPDRAWKIRNLPPGFSLSSVTQRLMSASRNPVQHIVLTDGLVSVSVFISKVEDPKHIYHGAHNRGVINVYARDLNRHQITVIGEVPKDTVISIGESVFYSDQ